jgi:hypothetical protein
MKLVTLTIPYLVLHNVHWCIMHIPLLALKIFTSNIKNILQYVTSNIKNILQNVTSNIKNILQNVTSNIKDILQNVTSNIKIYLNINLVFLYTIKYLSYFV